MARAILKVKAPLVPTVSESVALSRSVTDAPVLRPETVPPMVNVGLALHETETVVTLDDATVPEAPVTVQVSPTGCVLTVTL